MTMMMRLPSVRRYAATALASGPPSSFTLSTTFSEPSSAFQWKNNNSNSALSPSASVVSSFSIRSMSASTIYKFDVDPEHLKVVQATLPAVTEAGTNFTKHFYKRLFAAHPELMNVFNQTNQAFAGQPKKLLKTVALAAQMALENGELPGVAIEAICQKHSALNIQKEAYDVVGEHLLGTIEDLLTKDPSVLEAWGSLYRNIANAFTTREAEITSEVVNQPGAWNGRRKFILEQKEKMSSVILRFKFRPVDGLPTPAFKPGTFTTVWAKLDEDEEGPYGTYVEQPRHYTLALPRHSEDKGKCLSISVKKEGLVSRLLHSAEVGSEWELSTPHGCFDMSGVENLWLNDVDAPAIFLSAGVGITPVLAMLESIYATRPATWLHASQNGATQAYRDRLREIASVRAGELQRRVWYSNPIPEDGTPGGDETSPHLFNIAKYHYKGRMDLEAANLDGNNANLLHFGNPDAHYFMCGPKSFMNDQRESLIRLGVQEDNIHSEGFA